MESIIQHEKECFVCGRKDTLHKHHCLMGSMRKLADQFGLWVWLCERHHTGDEGVHTTNEPLRQKLQIIAQKVFMAYYNKTKDEFIRIFGRSFLC